MSKRLILILALAFVLGLSLAAYAEVQNVKVSGDINIWTIARDNIDLGKERPTNAATALVAPGQILTHSDKERDVLSAVRVKIDADLTDNVATTVRLINERTWDTEGAANTDIDLDLAYATLKEFLYSPLTLTLGRQELHFGNDMIVGDPDTNGISAMSGVSVNAMEADLSLRKAFDAMRATLNYDPLVLDAIYAKINEGTVTLNDDTTLYGINANYALDKQTTLEGYFFTKITDANNSSHALVQAVADEVATKPDKVYTVGARVVNTSLKNLVAQLEAAYQFGSYNPALDVNAAAAARMLKRQAFALEAIATYDLKDIAKIAKYSPSITGMYIYLSGDNQHHKGPDDNKWRGWDAMYENQTVGHLANLILGFTNAHILSVNGKMKPKEDVTLSLDYAYFWLTEAYTTNDGIWLNPINSYTMNHNRHLGQEIDAKITYDYTEDVQLGLLAGMFIPGSAFQKGTNEAGDLAGNGNNNRSMATEVIGSMKVTF